MAKLIKYLMSSELLNYRIQMKLDNRCAECDSEFMVGEKITAEQVTGWVENYHIWHDRCLIKSNIKQNLIMNEIKLTKTHIEILVLLSEAQCSAGYIAASLSMKEHSIRARICELTGKGFIIKRRIKKGNSLYILKESKK